MQKIYKTYTKYDTFPFIHKKKQQQKLKQKHDKYYKNISLHTES